MVIAFIFISLFVFLGSKILFSVSKGEITATRFSVNLPFAVQIDRIFIEEDDTVKRGDLLFTYNTATSIESSSKEAELWLLKERMAATQRVELAQIEIRKIKKVLSIEKAYSFKVLEMVRQNLKYKEEYDEHLYKVQQLQALQDKLEEEHQYYLEELRKLNFDFTTILHQYHTDTARTYLAPMDGVVNRILSPERQFMDGTEIMKIINNDDVHAYAYVELRSVNRFAVDDEVLVIFPDYHQGKATITHIYREIELLPEDLRILDGSRYALLKLTPVGLEEKEKWSKLDGTTVKVLTTNFKNRHLSFEFLKDEENDSTKNESLFYRLFHRGDDTISFEEDTIYQNIDSPLYTPVDTIKITYDTLDPAEIHYNETKEEINQDHYKTSSDQQIDEKPKLEEENYEKIILKEKEPEPKVKQTESRFKHLVKKFKRT